VVFASLAGAQQPANATPPLRGHVRSAGGQPLPDAEVNVDGARSSVHTDAQGGFSVPNLSKGIHTISVRRIGYLPAAVEIETPQANDALTLTLVPSRQELDTVKVRARINVLGGIVVDARNRPLAGATVDLIGDRLRGSADTTGDDGWFTFTAVRSGPIVLHVVKEGYVGVTQSIDLKDWRGVVVHMASMDTTLSKSKQRMLSGLGNTSRHVWLETLQRLSRRNVQSIVHGDRRMLERPLCADGQRWHLVRRRLDEELSARTMTHDGTDRCADRSRRVFVLVGSRQRRCYTTRLPFMRCQTIEISASTSRIWINPPPIGTTNAPSAQSNTSITPIVRNMMFASAVKWTDISGTPKGYSATTARDIAQMGEAPTTIRGTATDGCQPGAHGRELSAVSSRLRKKETTGPIGALIGPVVFPHTSTCRPASERA